MALFLDRADETPKRNDERLTAAWEHQLQFGWERTKTDSISNPSESIENWHVEI